MVVTNPESVRAPVGDTVILACEVDGRPAPEIKWLKAGRLVNIDDRVHLTEEHFLEIEESITSDSGTYVCQGVNSVGRVRSSRTIVTIFDPRLERENQRSISNGNINNRLQNVIERATARVMTSVNQTISRLVSNRNSDNVSMRDLFALSKFPPRPSLATAVAAEVFEESAALVEEVLSKNSLQNGDIEFQSELNREDLDRLKELAGCVKEEKGIDCDSNFCFHQRFRSHDG